MSLADQISTAELALKAHVDRMETGARAEYHRLLDLAKSGASAADTRLEELVVVRTKLGHAMLIGAVAAGAAFLLGLYLGASL